MSFRNIPEHNRYSYAIVDEPYTFITFDLDRAELNKDPDLLQRKLAEYMATLPSEEYDEVKVFIDERNQLDYNEIRVVMEAKRASRTQGLSGRSPTSD